MKKFEYLHLTNPSTEDLNKYGEIGWELMFIVPKKEEELYYQGMMENLNITRIPINYIYILKK